MLKNVHLTNGEDDELSTVVIHATKPATVDGEEVVHPDQALRLAVLKRIEREETL